jgi:guanine deaminase
MMREASPGGNGKGHGKNHGKADGKGDGKVNGKGNGKVRAAKPVRKLMEAAIAQALKGMRKGKGGPFGAVVAKDGKIIACSNNEVLSSNDPTAHAEVVAIREACRKLGTFQLDGCDLYTSCEPCPMCLGAAYWARVDRIIYANNRADAEAVGFGDDFIYRELAKPMTDRDLPAFRFLAKEAKGAFREWRDLPGKTPYGPTLKPG